MRIAIWHNLPSGGGKRALFYHVRGLLDRGHALESWCPSTADQSYLPLGDLITEHIEPLTWRELRWRRVGGTAARVINLLRRLRAIDEHCRRCARQIDGGAFDVLFANTCMFLGSPSIARHTGLPSVLYLQEPLRILYEARPRLPWAAISPAPNSSHYSARYLRHWLSNWVDVYALRLQMRQELDNADAFTSLLVNSFFSRESVLRAYGIDARPCYLGVDTTLFADRHLPRERFVVGLSSFTPAKNIDFVIRALGHVRSPRRLVWIGNLVERHHLDELVRLAERLGVVFEPKIRLTDAEIVEILNRAAVMAYAPRLEPFGLVPLEANACGLPVVAVAEGGVRETVIDGVNGLLCEPQHEAMAIAIQRLLDDVPYAEALGANGRALVEDRWSLKAAIDRLEVQLLENAARHGRS